MKTGLARRALNAAKLSTDCWKVSQLQSQALERELTCEEIGLLQPHVARCDSCRARCDELRFVHSAARRYGLELIRKAVKT